MSLIEEGPYRLSRNPLYVGLLALHLAIALLVPSVWALAALPLSWWLVWWGAVRPEERFLHERFGSRTTPTPAGCAAGCEPPRPGCGDRPCDHIRTGVR